MRELDNTTVGGRIRHMRKKTGHTLSTFSQQIGCSENYVSVIERGVKNPSKKLLANIATLTNCSIDWLIHGDKSVPLDDTPDTTDQKFCGYAYWETNRMPFISGDPIIEKTLYKVQFRDGRWVYKADLVAVIEPEIAPYLNAQIEDKVNHITADMENGQILSSTEIKRSIKNIIELHAAHGVVYPTKLCPDTTTLYHLMETESDSPITDTAPYENDCRTIDSVARHTANLRHLYQSYITKKQAAEDAFLSATEWIPNPNSMHLILPPDDISRLADSQEKLYAFYKNNAKHIFCKEIVGFNASGMPIVCENGETIPVVAEVMPESKMREHKAELEKAFRTYIKTQTDIAADYRLSFRHLAKEIVPPPLKPE